MCSNYVVGRMTLLGGRIPNMVTKGGIEALRDAKRDIK